MTSIATLYCRSGASGVGFSLFKSLVQIVCSLSLESDHQKVSLEHCLDGLLVSVLQYDAYDATVDLTDDNANLKVLLKIMDVLLKEPAR